MERYNIEVIGTDRAIVVDALLTDEVKPHYAKISYTFPLDQSEDTPVGGATVWIKEDESSRIDMTEISPG